MATPRQSGENPRAQGTNPRAQGRRKVKLSEPMDLLVDGKVIGRLTALELDLDELKPAQEATQVQMGLAGSFDPVRVVWEHYCQVMNPRNKGLDAQTRRVIADALKVATVDECKRAIDGCKASKFHMGDNDRRKKYNRVSQILRGKQGVRTTREQIDMFLDILEKAGGGKPGVPSGVTSVDAARISRAKRDVLDGCEFPNDERVVAKAQTAREWLQQQGWRIDEEPGMTPRFTPPAP